MVLELRTDNQTIINDVNFEYTRFIDEINKAVIVITGNTNFQRNLLGNGNYISIYKDGVLDFRGRINSNGNIEGNSIKLIIRGEEEEYVKDKCDITSLGTNGVWTSTASATIAAAILNDGVNYSAGTIDTGVDIDFKVTNSTSLWNAFMNLAAKSGQEKFVDYVNQEIDLLSSLGDSNVDTLNEGTDFGVILFQESEAEAKKIIVYGKGDGVNQLSATATSAGYTPGEDNTKIINDPTCISEDECQQRANIELAASEVELKVYQVPIYNPEKDYEIGDTLTINAISYGITNESVRIVSITRGRKGSNEMLSIEVTNTEYSQTVKSSKQKGAQLESQNRDKQTYMQGSGNTLNFGGLINSTSAAPLIVSFNVTDDFVKDEAGNLRITQFLLDYDVDPFRKSAGTATAVSALLVDGVSAEDDADVVNSSGDTEPSVTGSTADEQIGELDIDVDTDLSYTATTTYSERCSTTLDDDYDFVVVKVYMNMDASSDDNAIVNFRIQIDGVTQIHDYFVTIPSEEDEYSRTYVIPYAPNSTSDDVDLDVKKSYSGDTVEFDEIELRVSGFYADHLHADGSLSAADHDHDDGTYNADDHDHSDGSYNVPTSELSNITIGDNVSDAASVNATSVDIYLDYWSGSAWVNKHSILSTGTTIDTNVDLSNSGTYPDATGFWRTRIYTNNADADLVQAKINIKHNLDN